MVQFFQTIMGRTFFEHNVPRIADALERIATGLERQNQLLEKQLQVSEEGVARDGK
jgi:hypothetical protein